MGWPVPAFPPSLLLVDPLVGSIVLCAASQPSGSHNERGCGCPDQVRPAHVPQRRRPTPSAWHIDQLPHVVHACRCLTASSSSMTCKAAVAQRAAFLPAHRAVQQRRGSLQVREAGGAVWAQRWWGTAGTGVAAAAWLATAGAPPPACLPFCFPANNLHHVWHRPPHPLNLLSPACAALPAAGAKRHHPATQGGDC